MLAMTLCNNFHTCLIVDDIRDGLFLHQIQFNIIKGKKFLATHHTDMLHMTDMQATSKFDVVRIIISFSHSLMFRKKYPRQYYMFTSPLNGS